MGPCLYVGWMRGTIIYNNSLSFLTPTEGVIVKFGPYKLVVESSQFMLTNQFGVVNPI